MTARCHWCRHVFGVNEQVPNGAVPDAVLPFHIKKDDAVARISQFVDKRRLFALKAFKEEFTPENVIPVYLPYMIVDGKASADVAGMGEIETRRYTRGDGNNKKTYYDADVYQVDRHVDFTVDDLPLESSRERANLDTSGQHEQHHQHDPAVRHEERGEVERAVPDGLLVGEARPRRGAPEAAARGPAAVDRAMPGRELGEPLRPRRALGEGRSQRARLALGIDVPAGLAVLVPPAERQRAACCTTSP